MRKDRQRRSIRLHGYDYTQAGAYFITICTQGRECLFGNIVDGQMRSNDSGQMAVTIWGGLPIRFNHIELDAFVMMPNHMHGIFVLHRGDDHKQGDHKDRPYGTLAGSVGRIVQAFKSITTHEYINGVKQNGWAPFPGKLWQRNYWEHIIRNEMEFNRIRKYVVTNPLKWELDSLNPNCRDDQHNG